MTRKKMKAGFRCGFTLIELIVAVAISAGIAALLISVASSSLRVWNRSNGIWATAAVANAVLDQFQADLTSAVFQSNGKAELAAQILTTSETARNWQNTTTKFPKPKGAEFVSVTDADIAKCRFGTGGTWIRFFVGTSGDTTSGDSAGPAENRAVVRAVSYQIVRRYQTSAQKELAYLLFRSIAGDAQSLAEGYDLSTGKYADAANPSGKLGDVGNLRNPNLVQAMADHVADFGVRFYSMRGGILVPQIPATGGAWVNSSQDFVVRTTPGTDGPTPVPDVAEVMVRILTEEGVQKLRLYENPPAGFETTDAWWDIVERYSHVYVRRFTLCTRGP